MNMKRIFSLFLVMLAFSASATATTNTTEVYNVSDIVVDGSYSGEPFTADSVSNLTAEISLDSNESLEATISGYNTTEKTGNQTFSLSDGSNTKSIQSFDTSTTTYVVDLSSENGKVSVLDLAVEGQDDGDSTVSGAAPQSGGFLSGGFFSAVPDLVSGVSNFFSNIVTGFGNFLGGLI